MCAYVRCMVYGVPKQASGMISFVTNIASGAASELNLTWGYYESSEGGCTKVPPYICVYKDPFL